MSEFLNGISGTGLVLSLLAYEAGVILRRRFRKDYFNPLLIAIVLVIALMQLMKIEYESYYRSAQHLSFLLTPATVSLAVPLYRRLKLLKNNLPAILCSIFVGTITALGSVLILSRLFRLSHVQYVTLLPKSITTAIGIGVSEELGGLSTITVAAVIVTGILGNVIAEPVFRIFAIRSPMARGLALGTSAHAIGTAKAMELGEIEGAMSSLSIVICGLMTVAAAPLFAGFH